MLTIQTADHETPLDLRNEWWFEPEEALYGENGLLARLVMYMNGTRGLPPKPLDELE